MKKGVLLITIFMATLGAFAQENITPAIDPSSFDPQTEITVVYDVTGTSLADLNDAYIWVWIPGSNIDAKYNVNPASGNTALSDNAKFEKSTEDGKTLFSLSFVPEDFFSEPICLETQLGMLIKGNDWSNGQSVDYVSDMTPLESCFVVKLISPTDNPVYIAPGGNLVVTAEASESATFTLSVEGEEIDEALNSTNYSFTYAIPQTDGVYLVTLQVANDENDTTLNFSYLVNTPSEELTRPSGIIPGINYDPTDDNKATLCLLAPGKDAAYVLGEFNDFELLPENKMYRDGEYFWFELADLVAEQEYAFQYSVDGDLIADPFADKILDPDDFNIPDEIYPNLKSYPEAAMNDKWYKNRLSVLQTGQSDFQWANGDFQKPAKTDLVIYELLMRDFFEAPDRNYENLIDTLSYLKKLGVNAIELMPIQEFAGNNSWGYNPTFMFAPDKAYGTEEALKKFIDAAHGMGIAVILDIVFNQQDTPNAFLSMWFDYENFTVEPDNPMFNVTATHPFSVFFDLNHESLYTQYYMDTTLHYWINEYQVDGYRFDLSKGFTQVNSGSSVGQWGAYDQSRINLLNRMYDRVREYSSDSYLILEHFAANTEETVLADHGFMLWGNMHWDYKDLAAGIEKNIAWTHHETRGWQEPNVVAYMESHDEERIMFELLTDLEDGQLVRDDRENPYEVRQALDRIKLANAFFYTIPGPKMLWQFGEFGYDESINVCSDGVTIGNCRTDPKPVKWEQRENPERDRLFKFMQALIQLKTTYDVFETGQFSINNDDDLIKEISLVNQENISVPASDDEMSVYVIGNFGMDIRNINMQFPMNGTWYDFFNGGETLEVSEAIVPIALEPGQFRLYVNHDIDFPEAGLQPLVTTVDLEFDASKAISVYPNPTNDVLNIRKSFDGNATVEILDMSGRSIMISEGTKVDTFDVSRLGRGLYVLKVSTPNQLFTHQFIKK